MGDLKLPYFILTGLYCGFIFYLSSLSKPLPAPVFFPGVDKVAHGLLYAGLAATLSVGIRRSNNPARPSVQFWVPLLFASLYGVSDEVHQLFVPSRTFDVWDLAADSAGAASAQLLLCLVLWKVHRSGPGPVWEPSASKGDENHTAR